MILTYQKEKFVDLIPELPEIFYKHWQDIALNKEQIPLDPAWEEYMSMEARGYLHVMTARDGFKLAGYIFSIVHPHLHYKKSLTAYTDLLYLRREYTKGFGVFKYGSLILASEKMLRDLGVQRRYLMCKVYHDLSRLFERLGYKWVEKIHIKIL